MQRVTVLLIFLTLMIVVLNLKSGQKLKVEQSFFDMAKYAEHYHAEKKLIADLQAPKVEEKVVEEVVEKIEPTVELTTESQIRGQKLFGKCITCHGKHGTGKKSQKAPKLAGQFDWYIADKIKQMQDGVWENKVMYPYIKNLSDQDRKDLGAFLAAYKW